MAEEENDFWKLNLKRHQSNKRTIRRREIVLSCLQGLVKPGTRILDLGCGVGGYSYFVTQKLKITNIVSLDTSLNSLKAGKEYYNLRLPIRAHALYLPFKHKTFELVLMTEVIEDIEEQRQLFSEISRVIKDRGYLILTTSPVKSDLLFPLAKKVQEIRLFGFDVAQRHVCEQHPKQVKKNLEECGFTLLKEWYWNIFHLYSMHRLMSVTFLGVLIDQLDRMLSHFSQLCADFGCIAQKEGIV